MTKEECVTLMEGYLTKVTNLFKAVPKGAVMFIQQNNTDGLQFVAGTPVNFYAVAANASEETSLKTGTEEFINVSTFTYWKKVSGSWVGTPFLGTSNVLCAFTLLVAKNTGKTYLYANNAFHEVDVTSTDV